MLRALLLAGLLLANFQCEAQGWKPTRPVAFITPSSPAGSLDLTARVIQKIWDEIGRAHV